MVCRYDQAWDPLAGCPGGCSGYKGYKYTLPEQDIAPALCQRQASGVHFKNFPGRVRGTCDNNKDICCTSFSFPPTPPANLYCRGRKPYPRNSTQPLSAFRALIYDLIKGDSHAFAVLLREGRPREIAMASIDPITLMLQILERMERQRQAAKDPAGEQRRTNQE